jgi:translation initiation factor 2B subunit (eIF-2B alpha/beta/delta family)
VSCRHLNYSSQATLITLKVDNHLLREQLQHLVTSTGPALTRSIIFNIGGNASRSELDKITEPLKKLIANQARAKAWIEQALADASFPGMRISTQDKSMFVKRIIRCVSTSKSLKVY